MIEHLSFLEEKKFFLETLRVIKKGGIIRFSTVDFEKTIKLWLKAKDEWKDFHRDDENAIQNQFWFGTYTYKPKNRWGYLAATFYGSQNGKGQYHKNCYTKKKLISIFKHLNFIKTKVSEFRWQGKRDFMIRVISFKK